MFPVAWPGILNDAYFKIRGRLFQRLSLSVDQLFSFRLGAALLLTRRVSFSCDPNTWSMTRPGSYFLAGLLCHCQGKGGAASLLPGEGGDPASLTGLRGHPRTGGVLPYSRADMGVQGSHFSLLTSPWPGWGEHLLLPLTWPPLMPPPRTGTGVLGIEGKGGSVSSPPTWSSLMGLGVWLQFFSWCLAGLGWSLSESFPACYAVPFLALSQERAGFCRGSLYVCVRRAPWQSQVAGFSSILSRIHKAKRETRESTAMSLHRSQDPSLVNPSFLYLSESMFVFYVTPKVFSRTQQEE